ncbi:MAG: HAD family hydrolase [Erysipelotrichaceae bacterium]|nr:HAD family hydrolase [Erysipelotrichaceae bacterium]
MTMNEIRIAAFDVDGTLFDEKKKEFPQSAIVALKQLNRNGIMVALVTGRPPLSARSVESFGVRIDAFVCCNGHLVFDDQGKVIMDRRFSGILAQQVWEYCQNHDIGLMWKYPDKAKVYTDHPEFQKIFAKNRNNKGFSVSYGQTDYHWQEGPSNGVLACDLEKLEEFNREFTGKCVAVDINGHSSDLLLYGVTKQVGFRELLAHYDLLPQQCIAFGDNNNDAEIISYAGTGVCMGNGTQGLKDIADYVTTDIGDDGIRNALQHFHLI